MECFSVLLEKEVQEGNISLIPKCKCINLCHLIFADDLMIFSRADMVSLAIIDRVLNTFAEMSGLQVNKDKSTQMFAGVTDNEIQVLRRILHFNMGKLPMRYLGVPLISGRLSCADCSSILESIKNRLAGWKTQPLSYAGRLTLIKSILQGSYIY